MRGVSGVSGEGVSRGSVVRGVSGVSGEGSLGGGGGGQW